MSVTANVVTSVSYRVATATGTAGSVVETLGLGSIGYSLDAGNLASQILYGVSASATLTASSTTYDLTAFPSPTGNITLAKLKLLYAENNSSTDGAILYIGNAATNIFSAFLDTTTARIKVMPGSSVLICNFLLQAVNPWTIDSTHKNLLVDSGSATIPYKLCLLGI